MESFLTDYQTIVWGIETLPQILTQCGATKVMFVVDRSFPYLTIKDEIESIPLPHLFFDQFSPNPLYEDVCKGVDLFRSENCDTLVAIGGGSSIDVAKCIKLYCKMDPGVNYLQQESFDSQIPLLAIPTTAGTGSESTRFAVIYYDGKKQSVNHISIIPTYAILEPSVLRTLPLYQKKCTVLDALCQGIESWWSVNSTQQSQILSRKAVQNLWTLIEPYIFGTGDDVEELRIARKVMEAANWAGQAINFTQTTAPHAFSYKITSMYHLPHGHAVAICLPEIWDYQLKHSEQCIDSRGSEYLNNVFKEIAQAIGCSNPQDAVAKFFGLLFNLDMTNPISVHSEQEIDLLSQTVNPIRLKNNPVLLTTEAIHSIYQQILN